jgi:hypothetical protein
VHGCAQELAGGADNPIVLDDGEEEEEDGYAYENEGEEGAVEGEEGAHCASALCTGVARFRLVTVSPRAWWQVVYGAAAILNRSRQWYIHACALPCLPAALLAFYERPCGVLRVPDLALHAQSTTRRVPRAKRRWSLGREKRAMLKRVRLAN